MTKLTLSRADLMSGNWQNTKAESYPSPDDVPIMDAVANILLDWMETEKGIAQIKAAKQMNSQLPSK